MLEQQKVTVTGHLRLKRGIYQLVTIAKFPDGTKKEKSKSTGLQEKGNKKRAERMLADLIREMEERLTEEYQKKDSCNEANHGLHKDMMFSDYLLEWLELQKPNIRLSTYSSYSLTIKNVIAPYFQDLNVSLCDLTPFHIKQFYNDKLKTVSKNTIVHYHANIRKALQNAYLLDLIPNNPADKVEKPKVERYEGQYYDEEDFRELFKCIHGDPIEIAIIFISFFGLRRSELVGIRWSLINFKRQQLKMGTTVVQIPVDGHYQLVVENKAKTKSSIRAYPLVDSITKILLQLKSYQQSMMALCGDSYCKDYLDFVFVDKLGRLMKPNYISQHFQILLEKYNLKKIRLQDLRHSCATLMRERGMSIEDISKWLGHSNTVTTEKVYVHFKDAQKIKSAEAISDIVPDIKI